MRGGNGEEIGRGSQGKVVKLDGLAVKTTNKQTALIEQLAAEKLKRLDPEQDYTIYGIKFEEQSNGKWNVSMKYGGKSLQPIEDAAWFLRYTKEKRVPAATLSAAKLLYEDADKIQAAFDHLMPFVKTLWANGIVHKDIKFDNLVWDGRRLYLIDWGEAIFEGDKQFAKHQNEDTETLELYANDFASTSKTIAPLIAEL